MNKISKIFLSLAGLSVLLAGITAGIILINGKTPLTFRERAAGVVPVYFSPATQTIFPGNTFTLNAKMDTSGKTIIGIDLRISYNPAIFTITGIQAGTGITTLDQYLPINGIDTTTGTITYGAYTLDKLKGIIGTGVDTLKITGTVKTTATSGNYDFAILPQSSLSASGDTVSALGTVTSGRVIVTTPTNSPTPTPTKTPTPTPTPTPTKSPTPTPTKSPTPTPLKPGDVDGNGKVDIVDIGILIDNYGSSPPTDSRADLNHDNIVNIIDIGIVIDYFGT